MVNLHGAALIEEHTVGSSVKNLSPKVFPGFPTTDKSPRAALPRDPLVHLSATCSFEEGIYTAPSWFAYS
jgi:hypothetical protein